MISVDCRNRATVCEDFKVIRKTKSTSVFQYAWLWPTVSTMRFVYTEPIFCKEANCSTIDSKFAEVTRQLENNSEWLDTIQVRTACCGNTHILSLRYGLWYCKESRFLDQGAGSDELVYKPTMSALLFYVGPYFNMWWAMGKFSKGTTTCTIYYLTCWLL